jgi:hypothetical protein
VREPSLKTKLLGSTRVVLLVWAIGALVGYGWLQDGSLWPLGVAAILAIGVVMRAHEQVRTWRQWKRQWDAMGEPL